VDLEGGAGVALELGEAGVHQLGGLGPFLHAVAVASAAEGADRVFAPFWLRVARWAFTSSSNDSRT
jgi:hypothetical protein